MKKWKNTTISKSVSQMKKTILLLFFFSYALISCIAEKKTANNLRIGVISDLHYLSQELMDDGEAAHAYANSTGRNIVAMPEIIDLVVNEYLQSDINYLFIPGDLTKDGERKSHEELVKKLSPLVEKGVKIRIIPGNHDVDIPNSVGFKGKETYQTKSVSTNEFEEIYNNFGYGDAIYKDSASLSYVSELEKDFWLIAIDAIKYDEQTTSSITEGRIKPETERWINQILDEARVNGKTVIGMMHHGLVEHLMYQNLVFGQYLVDDWQRLANSFADRGMKAIFTGHFHATDITKHTSANNASIYDIETGALCSYPFAYRFISVDKNGMDIETRNMDATKSHPSLASQSKEVLFKIAKRSAEHKFKSKGFGIPPETLDKFADLAAHIFIQHAKGDEKLEGDISSILENIKREFDFPIDLDSNSLQLDFYPPDNNVKIEFQ